MAFESLPAELLMLILELLESTRDLYAVISASPAALRVFMTASNRILLNVTRRCLSPQSLRHAVATINIPRVRMNCPQRWGFKSLWAFLDRYFSNDLDQSEYMALDNSKARALATLHAHVCRHIKRYADQIRVQLTGTGPGRWFDESRQHTVYRDQQLSRTELIRLERGFYRYELYCRVFPAEPGNNLGSRSSSLEQFGRFIRRLEPWEVEEIVCVHQYFVYHLGTIVDDLENQLVARFLGDVCLDPPVGDARKLSYFDNLEMREMTLYSTRFRRDSLKNLEYIAASGLRSMNSMFHAATSTQRLDLIRSLGPGTRQFLADALYHGAEAIPHPPISRDFSSDDPSMPNLGYVKYAPDVTRVYMQIRGENIHWLPMRLLGYVFWDSDRLQEPLVRSIIERGQDMSTIELRQRFDRSEEPSAEARLDGFQVPEEVMDDIVKEFASTLELFPSGDETEEAEGSDNSSADDSETHEPSDGAAPNPAFEVEIPAG